MYLGSVHAPGGHHYGHASPGRGPDPVGTLLGMNRDELALQLRQGVSLTDIATAKGIGRDQLVGTIQSALPGRVRNSPEGSTLAARIADTAGPSPQLDVAPRQDTWRPSGGTWSGAREASFDTYRRPPRQAAAPADPVGGLLGMNADELSLQLEQGVSLGDIAGAKGIGRDELLGAIRATLPDDVRDTDEGLADAERIADTVGPTAAPPAAGPDPAPEADGDPAVDGPDGDPAVDGAVDGTDPATSAAVGALLGMNADELSLQLQQGVSLNDIANSKGIDHGDLIDAIRSGLPDQTLAEAEAVDLAEEFAARPGLAPTA